MKSRFATTFCLAFCLAAGCGPRPDAPLPSVFQYELFEAFLSPPPFPGNPFDERDIAVEMVVERAEGGAFNVPAFWHQDYRYSPPADGRPESFERVGEPRFAARFSPPEPGEYSWRWRIRTREGETTKEGGRFVALPARSPGPVVRVEGERHLRTADGQALFFLGKNVAWSVDDSPLDDMLRYLADMEGSRQNCARVWQCTWGFGIEHEQAGRYDLQRAWALDRIVDEARRRGIYLLFCFENAHDIKTRKSPYWRSEDRPKGIISEATEYYTSDEARQAYRNRVRYLVARYGHSDAILAWELFNEMEYTLLEPGREDTAFRETYFRPWLAEMSAAIQGYDAHGRLLTNSLATDRIWDEMNEYPWMDIVQHHTYLTTQDRDAAGVVLNASERLKRYGKPFMLGEFGGSPGGHHGQDSNVVHDGDPEGVHLRHSIWAGAFSGACGGPLNWWWDTYVRPNDLYDHYLELALFLEGTPWGDPALERKDLSIGNLRALALQGEDWARLYLQNRRWTWAAGGDPAPTDGKALPVDGLAPGVYRVEWWDTRRAEPARVETAVSDGALALEAPPVATDMAVRIGRE